MEKIKARLILMLMKAIGSLSLNSARKLGNGLGRLAWLVQPREAKTAQRNIERCFPELSAEQQRKLARESVIEAGRLALEVNVVWARSADWLEEHILAIHGEELVLEGDNSHGLVFLGPHVGNWEALGLFISRYGDSVFLYQPPKKAYLEPMMLAARQRTGATLLPTDVRGVAGLLRVLKKSGIAGILPDQNPDDGGGAFAPFYGHQAQTMTLVHKLLQKSGARVLMAAAVRVPGGFSIHFWEPPQAIYSEDPLDSLAALNQGVEQAVALAPAQYQWEYKRFRRQPEGLPRFYDV